MRNVFLAFACVSALTAAVSLILLWVSNVSAAIDTLVVGVTGAAGWTLLWIGATWIRQGLFPRREDM